MKLEAEASAYQSLDADGKYVAAARVAIGSIFGAAVQDVPADRRFYAGGGGSVRGYAYQGIGPKDPARPTDGRPVIPGDLGRDAHCRFGDNSASCRSSTPAPFRRTSIIPTFRPLQVGAGIGVRYLTPFGPLRVDAAIPLNREPGDPDFGIYAGIGQAF